MSTVNVALPGANCPTTAYQFPKPLAHQEPTRRSATLYAESRDGVSWTTPALGLVPWGANDSRTSANNIVFSSGGADPNRGGPEVIGPNRTQLNPSQPNPTAQPHCPTPLPQPHCPNPTPVSTDSQPSPPPSAHSTQRTHLGAPCALTKPAPQLAHDCWEWPTWRVVNDIITPATAHLRYFPGIS